VPGVLKVPGSFPPGLQPAPDQLLNVPTSSSKQTDRFNEVSTRRSHRRFDERSSPTSGEPISGLASDKRASGEVRRCVPHHAAQISVCVFVVGGAVLLQSASGGAVPTLKVRLRLHNIPALVSPTLEEICTY